MPDALRGVAQREDQVPGIVAGESLADPEIVRGTRLQAAKALLDEGQPGIAGGVLGQVLRDERLEGANPEQPPPSRAAGPRSARRATGTRMCSRLVGEDSDVDDESADALKAIIKAAYDSFERINSECKSSDFCDRDGPLAPTRNTAAAVSRRLMLSAIFGITRSISSRYSSNALLSTGVAPVPSNTPSIYDSRPLLTSNQVRSGYFCTGRRFTSILCNGMSPGRLRPTACTEDTTLNLLPTCPRIGVHLCLSQSTSIVLSMRPGRRLWHRPHNPTSTKEKMAPATAVSPDRREQRHRSTEMAYGAPTRPVAGNQAYAYGRAAAAGTE